MAVPAAAAFVALVVVGPWAGGGALLLLDWVLGPARAIPRAFWGLDNGLGTGLPFTLLVVGATRVVSFEVVSWAAIAVVVAVSFASAARFAGGPVSRRLAAGALYALNPVVYERLAAGQIAFLAGYAILPSTVSAILRATEREPEPGAAPRGACWCAASIAFAPHFAWILAVVVVVSVATNRRWASARGALLLGVGTAASSAYLLLVLARGQTSIAVTGQELDAFSTTAHPLLGRLGNLLTLYGFWRAEPLTPRGTLTGWPFILSCLVIVMGAGSVALFREARSRRVAVVLAASGAVALVLAMGVHGPSGDLFRWAYGAVPGFAVMREPQKFIALPVLAWALAFGHGTEALLRHSSRAGTLAMAPLLLLLPIAYTPALAGGLAGRVSPSTYPASWHEADATMGAGDGAVLFLPWHQYLSFPFSEGVIANPAEAVFRRRVISGDNAELPGTASLSLSSRSAYLETLYREKNARCGFGTALGPLGVEFVVLSKVVDWRRFDWIRSDGDLEIVLDGPDLLVLRNLRYRPVWFVAGPLPAEATSVPAVCDLQRRAMAVPARRASEVEYVAAVPAVGHLIIPEPFDDGWRADGPPRELPSGTTAVPVRAADTRIRFRPWSDVRAVYAGSGLVWLLLLVLGFVRAPNGVIRRLRGHGAKKHEATRRSQVSDVDRLEHEW